MRKDCAIFSCYSQLWEVNTCNSHPKDLDTHLLELKKTARLSTINEKVVVVYLAKQVLIPLFGRVELEKSYRPLLEALGNRRKIVATKKQVKQ